MENWTIIFQFLNIVVLSNRNTYLIAKSYSIKGHYGNEAELDCECTILIKDHAFDGIPIPGPFQNRGILLLRNPMDVLFTSRHYEVTRNQTGTATMNFFQGSEWKEYVDKFAKSWTEHAQKSIQYIRNGTVIFYESLLLGDTAAELTRLLRVLNFNDTQYPPLNPKRMRCTLLHKNRSDRKRQKKTMFVNFLINYTLILYLNSN